MIEITEALGNDPLLRGLIAAADEDARRGELERLLVDHARPMAAAVIARFARSEQAISRDDFDDVHATVLMRLMTRLSTVDAREDDGIRDFEGYVATLTYRTIYDFMRDRFPERTRLKNRLRYLLEHDPRFAIWSTPTQRVCGLRSWAGRTDTLEDFAICRGTATPTMLDRDRTHDAVAALFERAGRPVALETLVRTAAELWDVIESRHEAADESLQAEVPGIAARYETRQFLGSLWNEIRLLPANQRTALLLNLREPGGVNAVALIAFTGVARFDEIAGIMDMSEEELTAVWDELPFDDLTIAARLGLTRQQVINLRRSARDRLARRMSAPRDPRARRLPVPDRSTPGYEGRRG